MGLNYVIDGYNDRVSLFYQYGDINSKRVWMSGVKGDEASAVGLDFQIQL